MIAKLTRLADDNHVNFIRRISILWMVPNASRLSHILKHGRRSASTDKRREQRWRQSRLTPRTILTVNVMRI